MSYVIIIIILITIENLIMCLGKRERLKYIEFDACTYLITRHTHCADSLAQRYDVS